MEPLEHPDAATLAAFAARRLGQEAPGLREHLVVCASCARAVLDLRGELREREPEIEASWKRFRASSGLFEHRPGEVDRRLPGRRARWAAALVVFLVLAAFTLRSAGKLRQSQQELATVRAELEALLEPQVDVVTAVALPSNGLRGGGAPAVLAFGPDSRLGVLRLVLLEPPASAALRLTVADRHGTTLTEVGGLRLDADGNVTLAVFCEWLPPGSYLLRLEAATRTGTPVARYQLEIQR